MTGSDIEDLIALRAHKIGATELQEAGVTLRHILVRGFASLNGAGEFSADAMLRKLAECEAEDFEEEYIEVLSSLRAENEELRRALGPFSKLEIPPREVGSVGIYGLGFADIHTARSVLAAREGKR